MFSFCKSNKQNKNHLGQIRGPLLAKALRLHYENLYLKDVEFDLPVKQSFFYSCDWYDSSDQGVYMCIDSICVLKLNSLDSLDIATAKIDKWFNTNNHLVEVVGVKGC